MSDGDAAAAAEQDTRPAAEQSNQPVPLDCCGGLNNVDYSKMDLMPIEEFLRHINFHDPNLSIAAIAIIFNPLFWNVLQSEAQLELALNHKWGAEWIWVRPSCSAGLGAILNASQCGAAVSLESDANNNLFSDCSAIIRCHYVSVVYHLICCCDGEYCPIPCPKFMYIKDDIQLLQRRQRRPGGFWYKEIAVSLSSCVAPFLTAL
ncbi:hypothetical protein CCH79_00003496, partial [Gambusia affinis]